MGNTAQHAHTLCYRTHIFLHCVAHICTDSCVHIHAWLKCLSKGLLHVHVAYLRLAFSTLMFHPPSLLFPHGHFDTTFPSAPSSSSFARRKSSGQAHFCTNAKEFGYLADPTHSTQQWDCFWTLILPEILKTQNRLQGEFCAYLEVTRLFQSSGCARSKLLSHTVRRILKLFILMQVYAWMDLWDLVFEVLRSQLT